MHDVLDPRDLVPDEAEQLATSGFLVGDLPDEARRSAANGDLQRLRELEAELARAPRDPDWTYDEPTDEAVLGALAASARSVPVDGDSLNDRIRGAWLGRAVGNTLGKPVEGLPRAEIEAYLRAAGEWPQTGYLPLLDPLPAGVGRLHPSAPLATAGNFVDVPRDDDIDWTILNLFLLERHGPTLTTAHILAGWLDRIPFSQTYTAERAAYRNAIHGLQPPDTATMRNPYREWIGALIRGDAFGYVNPGDPARAASMALVDGRLSHVANGLYGEMWASAMVAAAFATDSAEVAIRAGLLVVPQGSRLAGTIRDVLTIHGTGVGEAEALDWVDVALGRYPWVHTLPNAALIAIALLWGDTFMESAAIAIAGGRDTDSTTATVGSVFGALHGADAIPARLVGTNPVHVRSAVRDFDRITIDELTARTRAVTLTRASG